MLGFVIGTVCLIGLIKVLRHGRGYGHGCGGRRFSRHGGCGEHRHGYDGGDFGGYEGRGGFGGPRFFLRGLLERLDATPAQEKVIVDAVREVRETAFASRDELKKSRADVAKAMRSPAFDEVLFGELFSRHDTEVESLRKAVMGALGKIHDALDERQRGRLADMIDAGPGFFRPWAGRGYGI